MKLWHLSDICYVLKDFFFYFSLMSENSSLIISDPLFFHICTTRHTTCFSWYLQECVDTTLSVVAFGCQCGDVVPAHGFNYVDHGLCLVGVGRHHTGEELVAAVVTQLGGSGGIADLRYLRQKDGSVVTKGSGQMEHMEHGSFSDHWDTIWHLKSNQIRQWTVSGDDAPFTHTQNLSGV